MKSKLIVPFLIIVTLLLLAKVYVANELYYTSRHIQKLSTQINALKEERNILKLKIEKLKYKNTIIDPLFSYKPKKQVVKTEDETLTKENNEPKEATQKEKDTKELFKTLNLNDGE